MVRRLWSIPAMRPARTALTIALTLRPAASVATPERLAADVRGNNHPEGAAA